jgi:hypothetical protein
MNQSKTAVLIGILLSFTVVVTVVDSYIPHEQTLLREGLTVLQIALMAIIVFVTLRSLLREF